MIEIMLEFHAIVVQEKDASCYDDKENKMCNGFLTVCSLIDAAFLALLVIDPLNLKFWTQRTRSRR
jgi:hypothetical protein